MIINHNMLAQNSYRQLGINNANTAKSTEKLASGLRINRAGDDAAGLAISEKMRGQIRGLDQASRNSQDGISMIQTAEGALNETHSILQRMRELSVQSANGTNTADDRKALQDEVTQLKDEIDRIGNTTEFNTQKLLNGNLKSAAGASVGQNTTTGAVIGKLSPAQLTASGTMVSGALGAGQFKSEKVTIDGTDIQVDWQNLSTTDQNTLTAGTAAGATSTQQNAAKDLIVNTINAAIDKSGANVAHINGWVDPAGKLVLQSGLNGTSSAIKTDGGGAVTDKMMGAVTGVGGATGSNKFNGTTVASGDTFYANINGIQLSVKISGTVSGAVSMASGAKMLEGSINTAINAYNTAAGAANVGDKGHINNIKVNSLEDGRLEIVSESGPMSFTDKDGKTTAKDLGLSQAQTEAGGNGGMTFHIGANKGQTITFGINDMRSAALGVAGVDISTAEGAQNAIKSIDGAIKSVSSERSKLGAIQNRLEHTINNLNTSSENLTAAESRIRDTDMAKTVMENTKNGILAQAAQAMLAQANQAPQQVLQLLR